MRHLLTRLRNWLFGAPRRPALPKPNREFIAALPRGKVLYVIDGDTVEVSIDGAVVPVRLSSIDCPEDDQPWGEIAKAGLIKLVGRRFVHVEVHEVDDYERTVATLYVERENRFTNVSERMVMLGHAWVMRMYYGHLPVHRRRKLEHYENWAKSHKVGLWKTENPVAPWEWRKRNRAPVLAIPRPKGRKVIAPLKPWLLRKKANG